MPHKESCSSLNRMYYIEYGFSVQGKIRYSYSVCTNCHERVAEIDNDTGERKEI